MRNYDCSYGSQRFWSGSEEVFTLTSVGCFQNLLRCDWSPDGRKVTAGSSDRYVYIWDTTSRRILYKLPGHAGSVNDCRFHPAEPICEYPDFNRVTCQLGRPRRYCRIFTRERVCS